MDSPDFVDPYLDPQTGLLRNKVGAQTNAALDDAEGDLSHARLIQLMDHPVKPTGGLGELRAIHRYLFQDVYDWAGFQELLRQMHHSPVPHKHSEARIAEMTSA
ncbi:hypothetical protein [Devriesea agamarum]|uniref:hypothetical protein n=1 Tax=Devriesea agamarum TaxID=472569 RepID=UPI00071E4E84|nr:hypothetical protein [Devriesea agamarum]